MRRKSDFLADALHIFVLGSFAVAQPLFDLLARSAEFFVVRRSEPVDVVLLVVFLSIILPVSVVVVEGVAGMFGQKVRKGVHGVAVACLVTAIALQMLKRVGELPGIWLVVGAVVLGGLFTIGYLRVSPIRTFLAVLSPAVLLFPGLFLFQPGIVKVVFPQDTANVSGVKVQATTPVVMVIFDELPITSLMDEHRQIDPIRYPNFAALARDATWFRNATTVSSDTIWAVPAILTGKYPDLTLYPTVADHPHNLFTLLGGAYNLNVSESLTQLCPDQLCIKIHKRLVKRIIALLSDLSVVYLHILFPTDLSSALPSVTQNWMDFAGNGLKTDVTKDETSLVELRSFLANARGRARSQPSFIDIVETIDNSERPTLHFIHILRPHGPYIYLPSGKTYIRAQDRAVSAPGGKWPDDEWTVLQGYQHHLLQVGYVDTLLGKLLARLKKVGLYDRSLIVVTADHGVSFRPNDAGRQPTQTNFQDVMAVPLLIKVPYQRTGTVNDRNVETVDILPTIADILDIDIPWGVDGRSALDSSAPERQEKIICSARERLMFSAALDAKYASLERKLAFFGSGADPDGLFKIGPYREIIGRHVNDVSIKRKEGVAIGLDTPGLYTKVDLGDDFVPALITGHVRSGGNTKAPLHLAIAINGVIRATTQVYTLPTLLGRRETGMWRAVVDEASFRNGQNEVEVFIISSSEGRPILERTSKTVKPLDYRNVVLGATPVQGIKESGFAGPESWWGDNPVRWTDGAAKLVIPIDEQSPPKALRVDLASTGPKGTTLKILVNGHGLFQQSIPAGRWSQTLSLVNHPLKDQATIELLSDTFVPREVIKNSIDQRTLGVAVEAVTLLESDPSLSKSNHQALTQGAQVE